MVQTQTSSLSGFEKMVLESLPPISTDTKKGWLKSPKLLKKRLQTVFSGFELSPPVTVECRERYTSERVLQLMPENLHQDCKKFIRVVTERQWGKAEDCKVQFVTPNQLGFDTEVTYKQMLDQANLFGLKALPFRVIPKIQPEWKKGLLSVLATQPVTVGKQKCLWVLRAVETSDGGGWGSVWPYWQEGVHTVSNSKFKKSSIWAFAT